MGSFQKERRRWPVGLGTRRQSQRRLLPTSDGGAASIEAVLLGLDEMAGYCCYGAIKTTPILTDESFRRLLSSIVSAQELIDQHPEYASNANDPRPPASRADVVELLLDLGYRQRS